MCLFFYILLELFLHAIALQTIWLQNQAFNTSDGLGYVLSTASNTVLQTPPQSTYMSISQLWSSTFRLNYSILNNPVSLESHCDPTVIFTKIKRRAGLRSGLQLRLEVQHQFNNPEISTFSTQIELIKNITDPSTAYFIEVYVMASQVDLAGTEVTIRSINYMQIDSKSYFVIGMNDTFYNGSLDLDAFVGEGVRNGAVDPNDTLNSVRIQGKFINGSDVLNFSYILGYDLQIVTNGLIRQINPFLFTMETVPNSLVYGEYIQAQVYRASSYLYSIRYQFQIASSTPSIKSYIQGITGYSGGTWISPINNFALPLDPTRPVKYLVDWKFSYTGGAISACIVLQLRKDYNSASQSFTSPSSPNTKQIHICPFFTNVGGSQGTLLSTVGLYNLYERFPVGAPPIYTYQTPGVYYDNTIGSITDLFQCFRELRRLGKFVSGEVVVSLAWVFKVYDGVGGMYLFQLDLPAEPLPPQDPSIPPFVDPNAQPTDNNDNNSSPNSVLSPSINDLACLWLEQNETYQTCRNSHSLRSKLILNIISMPNLAIIMQVGQVYAYIDDFTYFNYQKYYLGQKFGIFVRFMWNITSERWIPSSVAEFYYNIQDSYDRSTSMIETTKVPKKWLILNQGSSFVNNTRDYWIGMIPFTTIIFVVLHFFYLLLDRYDFKIKKNLAVFNWYIILLASMINQNIQYLAFRSFQQIFRGGSPSCQPFPSLYYFNYIACYIMLFLVTIYACASYTILRSFMGDDVKQIFEIFQYSSLAVCYMGITYLIKIINGVAHAGFYDDQATQIGILACGQVVILTMIVGFRSSIKLKCAFAMLVCQYVLRVVLYAFIALRIYFSLDDKQLSYLIDASFDEYQLLLILTILSFACLQIPIGIFIQLPKILVHTKGAFKPRENITRPMSAKAPTRIIVSLSNPKSIRIRKAISKLQKNLQLVFTDSNHQGLASFGGDHK